MVIGVILGAMSLVATTPPYFHPPVAGWIKDQRVTSGKFSTVYFPVTDIDGYGVTLLATSDNTSVVPNDTLHLRVGPCVGGDTGCPNGYYKVWFPNSTNGSGTATIQITATENTSGKIGYSSFTVQLGSSINPPWIQSLPSEAVQLQSGGGIYSTMFVIGDLNTMNMIDVTSVNVTATSSNHMLLDDFDPTGMNPNAVQLTLMPVPPPPQGDSIDTYGSRQYLLSATCKTNQTGYTVITVKADDGTYSTSTSSVLQVIDSSKSAPSVANDPVSQKTYLVCPSPTASPYAFNYRVASTTSSLQDLRVIATSSNTKLGGDI